MKHCLKILSFILAFASVAPVMADTTGHVHGSNPILVTDIVDETDLAIKKFRTSKNLANKNLRDLNVSASGQFSARGLETLFLSVPVAKQHVWIIDLRQESHGFINGTPISWYSEQNRANINKTNEQIAQQEQALLNKISKLAQVKVYTIQKLPGGEIAAGEELSFTPHKVQTEQQLVTAAGAHYFRVYVLDHNRPSDAEVNRFVDFIKTKVKKDDWLHFHCRGGKGRSSTFMAMYDMIHNAPHFSMEQIMRRQSTMGNIDFHKMPASNDKMWKMGLLTARYEFLEKFYHYTSDPNGYPKRSWSEWLSLNAAK